MSYSPLPLFLNQLLVSAWSGVTPPGLVMSSAAAIVVAAFPRSRSAGHMYFDAIPRPNNETTYTEYPIAMPLVKPELKHFLKPYGTTTANLLWYASYEPVPDASVSTGLLEILP